MITRTTVESIVSGQRGDIEQALKGFAEYIQSHRLGDLGSATVKEAQQYLADRADDGRPEDT